MTPEASTSGVPGFGRIIIHNPSRVMRILLSILLPGFPHGRRRRELRFVSLGLLIGLLIAMATGALIYVMNGSL